MVRDKINKIEEGGNILKLKPDTSKTIKILSFCTGLNDLFNIDTDYMMLKNLMD